MKLKTQAQVDRLIDQRIAKAIRAEERRDDQQYESAEYWKHHDRAIYWHNLAESLMPKGK